MRVSVFVPGHITGFFEIHQGEDFLHTGSRGCGVVISKGVYTTLELEEAEQNKIFTYINGEPYECAVTKTALEELLSMLRSSYRIEVYHELEVPMSQGFGSSAAGTLGAVLGVNKALNLNMTLNQCGQIAHVAEVKSRTGLGDVIAECYGGMVIREKPGAPGIGMIDRIPSNRYVVAFIVGKELETKSVLSDADKAAAINRAGSECMQLLIKEPSEENFLHLAKRFASETSLMSDEVRSAVKKLESAGIAASMIMLGNSVFALTSEPERVAEMLDYRYITAEIDNVGARIL